jgi:hypothetical protein
MRERRSRSKRGREDSNPRLLVLETRSWAVSTIWLPPSLRGKRRMATGQQTTTRLNPAPSTVSPFGLRITTRMEGALGL